MTPIRRYFTLATTGILLTLFAASASARDPEKVDSTPGARPGDASLTCEQIAAELQPYTSQITGAMGPMLQTMQEAEKIHQRQQAEANALKAASTAVGLAAKADPTGIASITAAQASANAQLALGTKQMAEVQPIQDKLKEQGDTLMGMGQDLQSDARLQRLMQLAQDKHCDDQQE